MQQQQPRKFVGEPIILPQLNEDPFTHFAKDFIWAGNFHGTGGPPTLEVLTAAWEELDAEQQAHYIVKAHNYMLEKQNAAPVAHNKQFDPRLRGSREEGEEENVQQLGSIGGSKKSRR